MSAHKEFVNKNQAFAQSFDKGALEIVPAKGYIVVTCMDARVEPASQLGIGIGEAHVIRNAGGSTAEALRTIIISQRLLGTREIAVLRHTDCGMVRFNSDYLRKVVKDAQPGDAKVAQLVDNIDFMTFENLEESVKQEVKYLQEHPLVLKDTTVTGWTYDVRTGTVKQIV